MIIKKIKSVIDLYLYFPRYREIIRILFKYGFGEALKLMRLQKILDFGIMDRFEQVRDIQTQPVEVRIRMALEELGPTFVKLGQLLSSRRDLLSESICGELQKLQKQVPPFDSELAHHIMQEEWGEEWQNLFQHFDDHPIAAASIAQVHRAILKNRDEVVVKIRRPDIEEIIEKDEAIIKDLARFLENQFRQLHTINIRSLVHEFFKTLRTELDFSLEAQNMKQFANQFKRNRHLRVPLVYDELTCERILTMEFLQGYDIDSPRELKRHHINPIRLSERISRLIFQQIFQYGFFHADPHPGNMTILTGGTLVLYDYGMMGSLSVGFRERIAVMIHGLVKKNHRQVTDALIGMSETGYVEDHSVMETDMETFTRRYLDRPLKDLRLGFVLQRLLDLLSEHQLVMKTDFYLGIKALSQVESVGAQLNPDLHFIQFGEPYARRVIENRYGGGNLLHELKENGVEWLDLVRSLPGELRNFYSKVRSGNFQFPLEHRINPKGYEPLRNTLNHISNRLANAFIISSILLSSSILILAKMPPLWGQTSILGILGLLFGCAMMLRLSLKIWKRGGM